MSVAMAFPDVAGELDLLLRATLLMGAAWAAAAALRKAGASAAARHMAWLLGIAALLALPVLSWLAPALHLPVLPAEAAAGPAPVIASPPLALAGPVSPNLPIEADWSLVLLTVYGLGAAVLLLRLIVGRRILSRLWSDAGVIRDPAWQALLARLASEMGLSRRVELRISRGPAVPMTWGTLAPKLLLPADASEWPPERRRLVLLHELAHIARRDSLSRSVASLACALYWFHPGVWFAARRMRMEQEHAADDRVLMAGGSPQTYALSLLDLARGAAARPRFDQAAAMAGMDQLERRLVSITGPARRNRPGTLFLSSSALLAGCTTLLVAAGAPVSATSTLPGPFRSDRADTVSSPDRAEDSAAPRRAERASPAPVSGKAGERLASETDPASQSRSDGPASEPREIAPSRAPRRDASVSSDGGQADQGRAESRDQRESPASAQQLSDYGWELQRRDSRLQLESATASSRPSRLILPAPASSTSRERPGRPKWARKIPRLVQGAKPTGSTVSTSHGPLMLSWSIGGSGD